MGKSPGKWIKSVLFGGRKSSKSNMSKARANIKPANGEETLFSAELPVSNRNAAPPLTSHPLPGTYAGNEVDSSSGQVRVVSLSHDGTALPSAKRDGDGTKDINDPESIRLEQAASEVQAAFRGYLARRAFRALKGIIRLQALVRGHLVRRQSAATLCCVLGIVRFQALVRGQKVRRSGIAVELHGKQILGNDQGAKSSKSFEMVKSTQMEKLSKKDFVRKVLALSPSAMPLRLQYGPGEPNSAWDWLERWTRSRIWEPQPVQKRSSESKSQVKHGSSKSMNTEQGRAKRGVQRAPNANSENGSINSTSESEKFKRNMRKVSSHSVESSLEHPPTEIEKVKRSLRKISNPISEASDRLDADTEKPKRTPRRASSSTAPEVSERGISDSAEKTKKGIAMTESKPLDADGKTQKDMEMTESKDIEAEESPKLPPSAEPVDPPEEHPNTDLLPKLTYGVDEDSPSQVKGLSSIDDQISDENQKTGRRRASLPAQQDDQENGLHSTMKVPSYMAATESAKAKLRIQASPKFGHDGSEKNGFTRRHSLPSSTNGKLSSLSPRVQKLVQAGSGKGGIRVDRSLSSSRDGNDKVIQPGWRR